MNYKYINFILLMALAFLCGCQPGDIRIEDKIICPGKATIEEAVNLLSLQRQNMQPFYAATDCVITYRDKDGEERREPVRGASIAFVPDDKIYFKGELLFKELRFGTNESQFWLRIKAQLDEFGDSYWWGYKEDAKQCPAVLPIHPGSIAEALGVVNVTPDWKMFNRDSYDILSFYETGTIQKRIYINTCDYRIEQIEYFDQDGLRSISVKLSHYSAKEEGIMVPGRIEVASYDQAGLPELTVLFELKKIRLLSPEKRGKKLFVRPDRDGYEHVFKLNEMCKFIEGQEE